MDLNQQMELHRRLVASDLGATRAVEPGADRLPDLVDIDKVISSLRYDEPQWFVLYAAAVHISRARGFLPAVLDRFQEEEIARLEGSVRRSSVTPPNVPPNLDHSPINLGRDPQWSSYFHSRCALAMLIEADQPARAIELLAPLRTFFPPRANVSHSWDISWTGRQIVWGLLKSLYERTEEFRPALEMSLVGSRNFGSVEGFQEVRLCLDGLGQQLWGGSASVADVTFLLDSCRTVLRQSRNADDIERHDLSECDADTVQYWAWTYGSHVARLVHHKPHLAETLLDHVQSNDWADGWLAVALIFESSNVREWSKYRGRALALYNAASVEYGASGVPYAADVPTHFGPEGDLYWAARVGFADTMLSLKGGEPTIDLVRIQHELEAVRTITSSHSQRSLRSEGEHGRKLDQIQAVLPREPDHIREDLQRSFGPHWQHISIAAVKNLIAAEHLWDSRVHPDQVRTELAKVVEAMIHSLMLEPVAEQARQAGMSELRIEFHASGRRSNGYPITNWRYMSFGHWAELLERARGSVSDPYAQSLLAVYPLFDKGSSRVVAEGLKNMAGYRGSSAHHSNSTDFETAMQAADKMRARILGSQSQSSLLIQMLDCFGVK